MVPEIIRYKIPHESATAFVDAYRQAGDVLRRSPNCLGYELLQSAKDAELYLLTIQWDSVDGHLQGFRRSADFKTFLGLIGPYVPNILEMEHYAPTELSWRRGE